MSRRDYPALRRDVRKSILERIDLSREVSDGEVLDLIDAEVIRGARSGDLGYADMQRLRQDIYYSIRRLDVLQELMDDPEITEIMVNGGDALFVERSGVIRPYPGRFSSESRLQDVIQQIVSACDRIVNASNPIVDCRLPDGSRVNVVLPPIALNGPVMTIRRFPREPITMEKLIRFGSVSPEIAAFLSCLVRAGYNIFVSGGTGSGKTTLLNVLSEAIPATERVITIEDSAELQLIGIPNLVRMEMRDANLEGGGEITIRDLIRASLRMRPDRIIVGEVRGAETIDMLQAMNTGHDGSMSTGHANSAEDMLRRLETMVLMGGVELPVSAIRSQIAAGLDIIVHLGRLRDRSRRVLTVEEVTGKRSGEIALRTLYRFREEGTDADGRILGSWAKEAELGDRGKLLSSGVSWPPDAGDGG